MDETENFHQARVSQQHYTFSSFRCTRWIQFASLAVLPQCSTIICATRFFEDFYFFFFQLRRKQLQLIHATHHLVVCTVSAGMLMVRRCALVFLSTLAVHPIATQNVTSMQTAHQTRLVSIRNVPTLAQTHVAFTLSARSKTTIQSVHVPQDTPGIHSSSAHLFVSIFFCLSGLCK